MTASKSLISVIGGLSFLVAGSTQISAQQTADEVAPEAATKPVFSLPANTVKSKNWMVAIANPYAANAAADVLRQGGNAIDAAIATQLVLGLVEPQSSGLGGGAFLVYYDAKSKKLTTLDGRETAPMAATQNLFLKPDGEKMKFFDAVVGGRSVGVPGTPKLLETMSQKWGSKPWADLFKPAITLSDEGFIVSPRLAGLVKQGEKHLTRHKPTGDYFFPAGVALEMGKRLTNPLYTKTLRDLAANGTNPFYKGAIGAAIVQTVQGFTPNPGLMTKADLAAYQVKEREPVCAPYRQLQVCGMGPPSSGALTVGQILGLLEPHDLANRSPNDADTWRLIGDASRLAFADRGRYMADIDFVKMPLKGLLKPSYLKSRSRLLAGTAALENAPVGEPEWDETALPLADDDSLELPSTTHFTIVDKAGNVVSMTSTIENGFGSRLMTNGFLLNNELTDFSFSPEKDGKPIANRVEPGKRPRSSMAPTIVMKDGKPILAVG